jgi:hypothetical protein
MSLLLWCWYPVSYGCVKFGDKVVHILESMVGSRGGLRIVFGAVERDHLF